MPSWMLYLMDTSSSFSSLAFLKCATLLTPLFSTSVISYFPVFFQPPWTLLFRLLLGSLLFWLSLKYRSLWRFNPWPFSYILCHFWSSKSQSHVLWALQSQHENKYWETSSFFQYSSQYSTHIVIPSPQVCITALYSFPYVSSRGSRKVKHFEVLSVWLQIQTAS